MITMTVYINGEGVCKIQNNLSGSIYTEKVVGAINKTSMFPYEIQVPIELVGNIYPKNNEMVLYFEKNRNYKSFTL